MPSAFTRARFARSITAVALCAIAGLVGVAAQQAAPPPQSPATPPSAQKPAVQPPPVAFTSDVTAIQVDAIVVDKMGRFVPDLRADEFEVFEDGKKQAVSAFNMVNLNANREPPPAEAGRRVLVDTQSNDRGFDGRLYIIVIDDLHILSLRTNKARQIARQFIERNVFPGDLAAVVTTSGTFATSQGFTDNRTLLLKVAQSVVGRKVISPALAGLAMGGTPEEVSPEAAKPERIFNARSSLETLTRLSQYAGTVRNRRKALVLVSEGIDYDFGSTDDTPRELRDKIRDFTAAANRANLVLYAFDPRVYTEGGDDFVDIASTPPGDMEAGQEKLKTTALQDTMRASQENLKVLATETGGFALVSGRAVLSAFDRVRVENSSYYMLGYIPSNTAQDGKFREIEVRVKRPGVTVQARKGYTAQYAGRALPGLSVDAKAGTSAPVRTALTSALPVTGFTIRTALAPFKGTKDKASVLVLVQASGRDLLFTPAGDKMHDSVELAVLAVDGSGKTRGGERVVVDMPLSQRMHKLVTQTGVVFQLRLEVPPGMYQLRIAGLDSGSGTTGSVLQDLEVPDFFAAPLAMSGIVVTGELAGQVPCPKPDPTLEKLLPSTPVTQRTFAAADTITALAEVYDNQRGPAHTVYITTTVTTEEGKVLFREETSRASTELSGARGGYGHVIPVPLKDVGLGPRILRIEAKSSLGATATVSRELPFWVR
jgi:VWFA-related protein